MRVGDKVNIPWWEYDPDRGCQTVPDLTGTIIRINGAYHYIKVDNNPKYDVLELYPNEFKVVENKS